MWHEGSLALMLAEAEYSELVTRSTRRRLCKFQKSDSDTRTKEMFYMLICNQVTLNLTLTLILTLLIT